MDYTGGMGGVDVADQRLTAHAHVHKPMTYFWRRVFDQKLQQAISNAYLLFLMWAEVLLAQCKAVLAERREGGHAAGSAAGAAEQMGGGGDLTVAELEELSAGLARMIKTERVDWDTRLACILMAKCGVGHKNKGGRRTYKEVPLYDSNGAKSVKVCRGGTCVKGDDPTARYKSKRTRGVCWCSICSNGLGKMRAVHLCKQCRASTQGHVAAALEADRHYTAINWAT